MLAFTFRFKFVYVFNKEFYSFRYVLYKFCIF
jgi:hypothetical protein